MIKKQHLNLRFQGFSDIINIKKLERETLRILYLGFVVAILFHAVLGTVYMRRKPVIVENKKAINVEIIVKMPRITTPYIVPEPFILQKKKLTERMLERHISRPSAPGVNPNLKSPFSRERLLELIKGYDDKYKLNLSEAEITELIAVIDSTIHDEIKGKFDGLGRFEPKGYELSEKITRKLEGYISLRDEMLNIDDLDSGKYKGLVVRDPKNKSNLKGFVYLPAGVWGSVLKPALATERTVKNMADGFKKYTKINLKVDKPIYLENPGLNKYPFLYISADQLFDLSDLERQNFGNYLKTGGLVLLDSFNPPEAADKYPPKGLYSLRQMLKDSLGGYVTFSPIIDREDPIFHTFFDIEYPEQLFKDVTPEDIPDMGPYMEAAWIGDKLVAIISDRGLGATIGSNFENPVFRIIVNMITLSLIKQNSLAVKYINSDTIN